MKQRLTPNLPIPILSIALISAGALAYEVLLMRLFSIIQWHHFAYMVISLALLGYGVSGTFISLAQRGLKQHFTIAFCINIALFSISSIACFLLAQAIPFNPETVLWDERQPLYLLTMYLLLAIPFFFAANATGLVFINYRTQISHAYSADLIGAGLGTLCIIIILFMITPLAALWSISLFGIASLLIAIWQLKVTHRILWSSVSIIVMFILFIPIQQTELKLSPYKSLSQTLQIDSTKIIDEMFSPLGMLSVVESRKTPLRHASGLSLLSQGEFPEQLAVFTDGEGMTVINNGNELSSKYHYLDQLTWALPYFLGSPQRVLILGAGGGSDVLQARQHSVAEIDAVEINPQFIELVQQRYGRFSGQPYSQPGVQYHIAEARGYITTTNQRYDLIQLPLLDSFSATSAGLYAVNESYLYTVEALTTMLSRLNPGGFLAISRWINLPPRDTLKLFATATMALEQAGIKNPGKRIILIRGLQTSTLLIKNGVITNEEIESLRTFTAERAFDLCWFPGITPQDANRYNLLSEPYFYNAARALLGPQRNTFLEQYKFNLMPATDDTPYYFQFFKWRTLTEIINLRGQGSMPLVEWGYLVLIATLLQAILISAILILLPLIIWRRHGRQQSSGEISNPIHKQNILLYFTAIGLAFLFIEIAFIQRFILFLHHPLYATAVVLTGFLIFAGIGSAISRRFAQANQHTQSICWAVSGIIIISALYLLTLGTLFELMMGWPITIKIIITLILIMPLAICMGIPFPTAMDRLQQQAPQFIPWAWGVNGCASVISAVLATLLAIHLGFQIVIMTALLLYLFAALIQAKKKA